jgi:hypothetical protein
MTGTYFIRLTICKGSGRYDLRQPPRFLVLQFSVISVCVERECHFVVSVAHVGNFVSSFDTLRAYKRKGCGYGYQFINIINNPTLICWSPHVFPKYLQFQPTILFPALLITNALQSAPKTITVIPPHQQIIMFKFHICG